MGVRSWVGRRAGGAYERLLEQEIDRVPDHVAVIQDGNRRYARRRGADSDDGHRAGEREALFDLIARKLREFADSEDVHDGEVQIRALGDVDRLPARVRDAVTHARRRTASYDRFRLNVALAYGGRDQLLSAARDVARAVDGDELAPEAVSVETIEERLYDRPVRDVDLIVRTGGDERTSNFLPWHANGNEAAVFFCAPYWPEFSRVDFLRAVRTYERRERSRRTTRARRALTLVRALGDADLPTARRVLGRFRDALPSGEREAVPDVDEEGYEPAD
ncbi:di-trans,poly-cis-decaprenylcistransferase [Halobacteriales archaeon SW_5_70_135]|nr:MAG: di-trans,poly-cis-decaprenylcistransferase [Halobacteriales archaeon SW_5_70_135]